MFHGPMERTRTSGMKPIECDQQARGLKKASPVGYLEIHDAGHLFAENGQAGAAVLVGHEDALRHPVVPVHDALEDGHGERVHCLALR